MPKELKYESKDYITTFYAGPGAKIGFHSKYKTYDENLPYRKANKLDVYDNDILVGRCQRFTRRWDCWVQVEMPSGVSSMYDLDLMESLNKYIKENKFDLPELDMVTVTNGITYFRWNHGEKGFFLCDKVHEEIRKMSRLIKEFMTSHTQKTI